MNRTLNIILLVLAGMGQALIAQPLGSPILHPPVITGGFGELRPDHFHAGVDLRSSKGKVGDPVVASGPGYISRVLVQHEGYGRAVYIRHPDGRSTVYAHLAAFMPSLQALVDTIRYTSRQEEIDLVFDPGQFPVKKKQVIGTMGMTGRTNGVHLHYEIRERDGYRSVNPLLNGVDVHDQIPPEFTGLKIYALDDKVLPLFETLIAPVRRGRSYRVKSDTLYVGAWRVGLGVAVQDLVAQNRFRTGVRKITISADGEQIYQFVIDQVDFHLNRYINAHLDYAEWIRSGRGFHRCYQIPGNRLPFYPQMRKAGLIALSQSKARKVVIDIEDAAGNASQMTFWIKRARQMESPPPRLFQYRIPFGEAFTHRDADIRLAIPAGAFYETVFFQFSREEVEEGQVRYQIHESTTPLHQFIQVALALPSASTVPGNKWIGAYLNRDKWISCGGEVKDGYLEFKSRHLGIYQLMADTIPPSITPLQSKLERHGGAWSFRIQDNVGAEDHLRNLHWTILLDDQWIPGEWLGKEERLIIDPDRQARMNAKTLTLMVIDERGNETCWESDLQ